MIPLYGFLEGDTIGLLILADENDTAAVLVDKLQSSARVRVKTREKLKLLHHGQTIDPQTTVAQARMEALDRVDVVETRRR
jgi:hypothetical protein